MVTPQPNADPVAWRYDRPEILADGIVHGVGLAFAVGASAVLLAVVAGSADGAGAPAYAIYCACLLITLTASAVYNLWPVSPTKWVLRRLDHAMIFALIAGTYTPFLARIGSLSTSMLLGAIWAASLVGMVVKLLGLGRRERLATMLYIGLGWSGIFAIGRIAATMPAASLALVIVGGTLFSGGAVFHHWRGLRFQNAIWHGFVLAGVVCHYAAVLLTASEGVSS